MAGPAWYTPGKRYCDIEHSAPAWVSVDEILEYELATSDRVFAETCLVGRRSG